MYFCGVCSIDSFLPAGIRFPPLTWHIVANLAHAHPLGQLLKRHLIRDALLAQHPAFGIRPLLIGGAIGTHLGEKCILEVKWLRSFSSIF